MASQTRLSLILLGGLEARSESEEGERHLAKGKPVALLAYLALTPGRRAARERLATLLWSDGSTESARQNLRQTLWYLKKRLGEIVIADDDGVGLVPEARSDVEDFLSAAQQRRFGAAVAAYKGDLIPDFAAPGAESFEEWGDLERRRLRATYLVCVEEAARMLLSSGHAREAIELARRARELAPGDPATGNLLLECLIAARDALGALALVTELEEQVSRGEVEGDATSRALIRAARKLATNGSGTDDAPSAEETLVPDLIGRESEFRTLVDAWEGARRGKGSAILLSGAAGLGKSRILADFGARVTGARGRVMSVRAHPGERSIQAGLAAAIASALAELPGAASVSPGSAAVLVALSPVLASTYPGAAPDLATGEDAVRRRAAALAELVTVVTESHPLVMLVDDGHWADTESIRLVASLRARVERSRALLVVSSRVPDELRLQFGTVDELPLAPLDVAGVGEFVGRLAGLPTEAWARSFVPRLHQVTHGIPLYLIETLQRLVEHGALARRDGVWHAASPEAMEEAMPTGSALHARVESLDAAARAALVRLATLGRPVGGHDLQPDEQVPDWTVILSELERRGFVARVESLVGVWHDEIAAAALDLTAPGDRLRAHAWTSDLLLSRGSTLPDFALAAHHAMRAADDARLTHVWIRALRAARRGGDRRPVPRIATDVLPPTLGDDRRQQVLRATPRSLRLHPWRRLIAAAAGLAVISGGAAGLALVGADVDSTTILYVAEESSGARAKVVLPPSEGWRAGAPLHAIRASSRESPIFTGQLQQFATMAGPHSTAVTTVIFPEDSGGQEVVEVAPDGTIRRFSPALGDDFFPVLSPDARSVLFSTRRFDRTFHQADLVVHDRGSEETRRITATDDEERGARWSPDGTRIAYTRSFVTERADPPVICVADSDGRRERCDWQGIPGEAFLLGWIDDGTLLIQDLNAFSLHRLDIRTGAGNDVGPAPGALAVIGLTNYVSCSCLDKASGRLTLMISTLQNVLALRAVELDGRFLSTGAIHLRDARTGGVEYLDMIKVEIPTKLLSPGSTSALTTVGFTPSGRRIPLNALRYSSSDSNVALVDPDGTVRALAPGRAWLHVSAGGWRTDSVVVDVAPAERTVVLQEDWTGPLERQWISFGRPQPVIVRYDDRPALLPNGDGVFPSGVYSRALIPTARGLTVEYEARLPVTRFKLQSLGAALILWGPSPALEQWDHTSLAGPPNETLCRAHFPPGEGGGAMRRLGVEARNSTAAFTETPPPPAFYDGGWQRIRIEYTTDGRCALFVNDEFLVRTESVAAVPPMARVSIVGHSVGAELIMRGLRVTTGTSRGAVIARGGEERR